MQPSTICSHFLYSFSILRNVADLFIYFILFLPALFISLSHYPLAPMPLFHIYEFPSLRVSFKNSRTMKNLLYLMVRNHCCFIYQLFHYPLHISSLLYNSNGIFVSLAFFFFFLFNYAGESFSHILLVLLFYPSD